MGEPFIERLLTVMYNDNVPVEMQKVLQGLIDSFYNPAKIFGEKGLTLEQANILFASLEKMCDQIVELGQTKLGSKEQLSVLKNMTDLLSVLNEQKICQPIITPLLKVMKHVESYYFVSDIQVGRPLQEATSEASSDEIAQLIEEMSEVFEVIKDVEKFEKTEVIQEEVNKAQIAPIIQKQPSPRKDVTEINPEAEADELKLKF